MIPKPKPHHFAPPKPAETKENRYNVEGRPVLYLSCTQQGVAYELRRDQQPINGLYCQEYVVELDSIRIADFSEPKLDNFIHMVFDRAEHGRQIEGVNREDYVFSQIIANIVESQGFSGMIIPGTCSTPSHQYKNIVIFNPEKFWRSWINDNKEPECIDKILQDS